MIDDINLTLLRELSADPRLGMSELARRVAMSAPAVTERVQRLQRDGVIAGFRLDVDPAAIQGLETTLDQFLLFGQTVSSLVVSTPAPPRSLVPARD